MYCKNCGKEIIGQGVFCQSCGAKAESIPAQASPISAGTYGSIPQPPRSYQGHSADKRILRIPIASKMPMIAGLLMLGSLMATEFWLLSVGGYSTLFNGIYDTASIVMRNPIIYLPIIVFAILFFTPIPKRGFRLLLIPLALEFLLRFSPIRIPSPIAINNNWRGNIFDVVFGRFGLAYSNADLVLFALSGFAFFVFAIIFTLTSFGVVKKKVILIGCCGFAILIEVASLVYYLDQNPSGTELLYSLQSILFYGSFVALALGLDDSPNREYAQPRVKEIHWEQSAGQINPAFTHLGGGLLAFVIIYIIGLFRTIDDVSRSVNLFPYLEVYPGLFAAMSVVLLGSLFLIITIILIFAKNRAYKALFNLSTIAYIAGLATVLIWCESANYRLSDFTIAFYGVAIGFEVLTLIIWNLYFAKSVRVKTYFASKYAAPIYPAQTYQPPYQQAYQPQPPQATQPIGNKPAYCSSCGNELVGAGLFCQSCGTRVPTSPNVDE
jgi:hypothetical protein